MEEQTISQVSKQFNISARTLRYYEQIGLLQLIKKEDFAYRMYDEATVLRLKQIIVLRKLRIPLKQIAEILQNGDIAVAIEVFQQNLNEIGNEITALSAIKRILQAFIEKLNLPAAKLQLMDDKSLMEIVDSLTVSKINFKEDTTMDDLNRANEKINKLTDKDVRIVYLPPSAVASIHCVGGTPEWDSGELLREFIKDSELPKIKPDFRQYGFNHPNGTLPDGSDHGYERWATVPDDMVIKAPFEKKHFKGGLYAAHMIPVGAFEEWKWLCRWAENSGKYEMNLGDPEYMGGLLEEHLNAINNYMLSGEELDKLWQLDLLIPIREKDPPNIIT